MPDGRRHRIPHRTRHHGRGPGTRKGVVASPDSACRGELPDLGPRPGAHPDPRPGPAEGRLRPGQQGPRAAGSGQGRRDHRRRRRDRRRQARRPVPDRRVPDRFGHQLQHEHQRGDRQHRRRQRCDRASQRRRQHVAVVQRHLPHRHPHRRHRSRCAPSHSGAAGAARRPGRQGPRMAHRGQVGPHASDGRRPGDAGPGVLRVRPPDRGRHRTGAGDAAPAG